MLNLVVRKVTARLQKVNTSLTQGIFPDQLKYCIIKPIYKNGNKSQIWNYRPVSLLMVFSKIMEILISQRLKQHRRMRNILTSEQYGFQDAVSTNNAIYKLINSVYEAWNNKQYITCIFCDINKAFDCVSHAVLLSKLEHYRMIGIIFNWFRSYLKDRRQKVYLEYSATHCFQSDWGSKKCGVPQGSIFCAPPCLTYI